MPDLSIDFLWSLAIGAAVICIFSYDQLDRPSYPRAERLARMLDLLRPSDIRSPSVFFRMYALYTGLLLAIYGATSLSGGLLLALLFGVGDGMAGATASAIHLDPRTPLIVSLTMVGLMPNPNGVVFHKLEERLRQLAHRLFGIPNSLFDRSDALYRAALPETQLDETTLAAPAVMRARAWAEAATSALGSTRQHEARRLSEALVRSGICRAWLLDSDIFERRTRKRYRALEDDLIRRYDEQEAELDSLATATTMVAAGQVDAERVALILGLDPGDEGSVAALMGRVRAHLERRWSETTRHAEELTRDVCALVMLYLEQTPRLPEGCPMSDSLAQWLLAARDRMRAGTRDVDAIIGAGVVVVTIMMLGGAGAWLLDWTVATLSVFGASIHYAMTTLATFLPAMLVSVSLRSTALEERQWRSAFEGPRPPFMQYLAVFLWCAAATAPFVLASHAIAVFSDPRTDLDRFYAHFVEFLGDAVQMEAPWVLIGALQGVFVALALDLAQAAPRSRNGGAGGSWGWLLLLVHAGLFLLLSFAATAHEAHVQAVSVSPLANAIYHATLTAIVGASTTAVLLHQYDPRGPRATP